MSIFSKILDKLGLRKEKAPPPVSTQAQAGRPTSTSTPGTQRTTPSPTAAPPKPQAMSETDVVAKLEKLAADNPQKLNWRTSIVDLLKLLEMDSSLAERKALAIELGCPAKLMEDSAEMNTWLHQEVLKRVAANGGNVPAELLD